MMNGCRWSRARSRKCAAFAFGRSVAIRLTGAIESDADSVEAIVAEMQTARVSERQGRLIDSDETASMEKKKREGYF